ncbi:MAG: tyrosine-type recombinase/integrase [Algiphilus sp.]
MAGKLTAVGVKNLKRPGWHGDGRGLWLRVREGGGKSWCLRYTLRKRPRVMGLGPYPEVTLEQAREKALHWRRMLKSDKPQDPIEERRAQANAARVLENGRNFDEIARRYIDAHRSGWRNEKHATQWENTLRAYASPVIGAKRVDTIGTDDVLRVLETIWREKPETATRVRQRVEAVLDFAAARGLRKGDNPARWRGHLERLLPNATKVKRVKHHPALPHAEVGRFVAELRAMDGVATLAFEFAILTAARTGEVVAARWSEIDTEAAVWTIPAERMKAGKEHRVPLTPRALEILKALEAHKNDERPDFVCPPGTKKGEHLSTGAFRAVLQRMGRTDITAHGFRSTFRDWAGEETSFARETIEAAMAHRIKDRAEASYARGDLFNKRRKLMDAWAARCAAEDARGAKVTAIGEATA